MEFDTREFALRNRVIAALNSTPQILSVVLEKVRVLLLELIPADAVGPHITLPRQLPEPSWEGPVQLEHAMAVLVDVQPEAPGDTSLARDHWHSFVERAKALLTSLLPHLTQTVRNCRAMEGAFARSQLAEKLHEPPDAAYLVVEPPARERLRSPNAAALLGKWFERSELHGSGLPLVLVERLDALTRMSGEQRLENAVWARTYDDTCRVVKFIELPQSGGPPVWALLLHELPSALPLPDEMRRRLTKSQVRIAQAILRNWNNEQIASEFQLTRETVKTHVKNIFSKDRLNCDNRTDFLYQAAKLMRPI
ncbi:LuxR C-terminal-related transcriptional regulator [Corallococcus sp. M34]|uniref:helix-turn-helix transcriptional regulator n=1 Tax=Citreicoccus inhibens TaxID=2849499 RepID=UPI001C23D7F4|nr:LuxR C-terminal-related transcriptional regulator [Citreicoccus inhibens]MBU8898331.1 LuxR C-terminal-related transcriptional regulator [Citreicoccus inhibens]